MATICLLIYWWMPNAIPSAFVVALMIPVIKKRVDHHQTAIGDHASHDKAARVVKIEKIAPPAIEI